MDTEAAEGSVSDDEDEYDTDLDGFIVDGTADEIAEMDNSDEE